MQFYKRWIGLIAVLVLALAVPLVAQAARADDGAFKWEGLIETRPTGTFIGTWMIDGVSFDVTASTKIEEEYHPLDAGTCAKVTYNVVSGVNVATKLQDEGMSHCSSSGDDGEHMKLYARLDAAPPADIYDGTWLIGGKTYTSTASTSFEFDHGQPRAGSCVEIEFAPSTPTALRSLESESNYKCDTGGSGTFPPGQAHAQVYGVLDSFPIALVGTWVVDGVDYEADSRTRFDQEDGGFFPGVCVDVRYMMTGSTKMALEIEVTGAYHCGSGGSQVEEKMYGLLSAVPANYTTTATTTWTIGGADFLAHPTTKFKEKHGAFEANSCVKVEFYTNGGIKHATEIETEEPYKCNNNSYTNKVYGVTVTVPDGLYGSWVISSTNGISDTYQTGVYTKFESKGQPFAAGQCVKVKYYVDNGVNKAIKIEHESPGDCNGEGTPLPESSKIYALLDSYPGGTLGGMNLGVWVIGGQNFTADTFTRYEAEHGAFAPGICVEAKYYLDAGGNKVLLKVETENIEKCQQAGGGGSAVFEFKAYGAVEAFPSPYNNTPATWTIGGIDYDTTATTKFEQAHGPFAIGSFVEVKYVISGTTNVASSLETHVASSSGRDTVTGVLNSQSDLNGDGWLDWRVNGVNYLSDTAIDVDASLTGATTRTAGGQLVALNTYLGQDGNTYVTYATALKQIFLPLIFR